MLAIALIALGVIMRILPHDANFAPIAAIALFGGVYLKRSYAVLLPVAALMLSDLAIGFDSFQSRAVVYGSVALIGLVGLAVSKRKALATVAGGSIAGSIIFYLTTNFVYFYPPTMYAHNLSGLLSSYYNALPFFRNTLLSDLFYVGALFGSYELILAIKRHKTEEITSPQF